MQNNRSNLKQILKVIGPGLLFASAAIGTSHLVLSTRAGAHHGMIFFWIILGTLVLKYPFFEFGARYTSATGRSLLKGFLDQGKWVVILFLVILFINMFAVTGALAAVSAGLLSTMFGMGGVPMPLLVGGLMVLTIAMLILGRYTVLDNFIKLVSVVLLITVCIAFVAVLIKGPVPQTEGVRPLSELLEGAGLALTVGLGGFLMFYQFSGGMVKVLEAATIISFLSAPLIAFLNLRAMTGKEISASFLPSKTMLTLAYLGLTAMFAFAIYYVQSVLQ